MNLCDEAEYEGVCYGDEAWNNIMKNLFPIVSKITQFWNVVSKDTTQDDESVMIDCTLIGDIYGSMVSYVLGFNKKF